MAADLQSFGKDVEALVRKFEQDKHYCLAKGHSEAQVTWCCRLCGRCNQGEGKFQGKAWMVLPILWGWKVDNILPGRFVFSEG